MKRFCLSTLYVVVSVGACFAQSRPVNDLQAHIEAMKASYAGSGTIVMLDDHTLVIEPNMPGPICSLPKNEGGKTNWSYFAFPLSSITVPLATVDESMIGEDIVFTNPDATKAYKPGDVGDTTMVVVVGVEGKQFHTLMYDREKVAHLRPGVHSSSSYGQTPDDVVAFGLTFADHAAARAFVDALKGAAVMAKSQATAKVDSPNH
jgi:hypothetical protein